ncbi:unnamed protein product [Timema podura]|uniref:Enoyl reductase (ER) domain-containing protein n=1 Tax=Timema podura TaxID=61482 RepID=A0ABN7NUU7_TIMPD|nr:unnamed protein product [Timema podura]
MDEVLFHISQHLEALQVNLNSSIQHGRLMLQTSSDHMQTFFTEVWSGQRVANLREGVERLYLWLADQVEEVKRLAEELIQPRRFLRQIQHLLENDLSRTGLYFGGLGFLFGSLFGVMLGLSWYRPPPPMQRMRAVVCTGYYGPDSLATVEDMPVPTISSPDQILVQVKAASVDTVDSKICYGYGRVLRKQLYKYSYNAKRHFNFPVILGRDCSGIIIEIGQKVKNFEVGDEVWFGAPFWSSGTMCECVVVKENMVAKKPRGVGFEVAASLPYTGTVAWNAMVHQAGLNEASTAGKRACYYLFKDSPSRRGTYMAVTGSSTFPMKFCSVRWLENVDVAKRALETLDNLKKFVEYISTHKNMKATASSASFKVISCSLKDKLLRPKLAFFLSLAEDLEPFLKEFQSDCPMSPFLHGNLLNILKTCMERVVKDNVLGSTLLQKVDLKKEENLKGARDIDIGYATRSALRKCQGIKDIDVLLFRQDCRTCLKNVVDKLLERSPLKFPLTEALTFLNPYKIGFNQDEAMQQMTSAMDILVTSNLIPASVAQNADREYKELVSQEKNQRLKQTVEDKAKAEKRKAGLLAKELEAKKQRLLLESQKAVAAIDEEIKGLKKN